MKRSSSTDTISSSSTQYDVGSSGRQDHELGFASSRLFEDATHRQETIDPIRLSQQSMVCLIREFNEDRHGKTKASLTALREFNKHQRLMAKARALTLLSLCGLRCGCCEQTKRLLQ